VSETKEKKVLRKDVIIALGIICIILVAGIGGTIAFYTSIINDKNNAISSLNTQVSELNSTVTSLKQQIVSDNATINSLISNVTDLQKLLNVTPVSVGEITANLSAWVDRAVAVEGNLSYTGAGLSSFFDWNYELGSNGATIGVSWQLNSVTLSLQPTFPTVHVTNATINGTIVMVLGVVEWASGGEIFLNRTFIFEPTICFIDAERIVVI
jgi:outer membrane murein-binding lipoprotein Lpp